MKTKILIVGVFLMCCQIFYSQNAPSCVPQQGLMAYWPLDGVYGPNDSWGGVTGTVSGAQFDADRFGCPDKAYCFNGTSDFIQTGYAGILGSNPRTVSFWAKTTGGGGTGMYAVAWGANGTGERFGCALDYPANSACLGGAGCVAVHPPSGTNNGNWNHYVYLFSGVSPNNTAASVIIYMNGVMLGSTIVGSPSISENTILGTVNTGANNVCIGKTPFSSPGYFNGCIDDVGIWNRVLTSNEISALYSCTTSCGTQTQNPPQGCCLGNNCGATSNPLTANYEIPLANFDFNFSGDNQYLNKVNIGYNCGQFGGAKLNVQTSKATNPNGLYGGPECVGISAFANSNNLGALTIGTRTEARSSTSAFPVGLFATASGPGTAYGVWSRLMGTIPYNGVHAAGLFEVYENNGWRNAGVMGVASGVNDPNQIQKSNIGVYGFATGPFPGAQQAYNSIFNQCNIGVYGGAGNWGNYYSTPSNHFAGWFDGDVMINATGYSTGFMVFASDKKFKNDIMPIENAMTIIGKLNPSSYFMKTDNEFGMNFSDKKQFGFISQEVETFLPELVSNVHKPAATDSVGNEVSKPVDFKGLNYMAFIPILTKGIQEQQEQIEKQAKDLQSQQNQIEELKEVVNNLQGKTGGSTGINATTHSTEGFSMEQNIPNPFSGETVIKYTLTQQTKIAVLNVYDLTGKQLTSFHLTEKGSSSITITSEKLAAGIYIYSIVADGKIMDSKRMVVAEK